jgi:hypothetical protein
MNTAVAVETSNTVPLLGFSVQEIPLRNIRESKTNPRRQFDEAKLAELADFVPGNKICVMLRPAFCVRRLELLCRQRRIARCRAHNFHSEQSHFIKSWSLCHPSVERCVSEPSTGGKQAVTAACFVRRLISA